MQPSSDKTFHLKWNNHLQNLSQLFTAIYSSSALADVTLACRDGALRAHKLVLSACSPYFEQIFKDNPCKHPVVILKGIPFSEINLLVEFMYKGSVDVQELDLQSLMHTASELEIRGLAYEVRANAAQLLNVNLEYPTHTNVATHPSVSVASTNYDQRSIQRTDLERLKQIHMYQQSMLRESEFAKRKKREEQMPPNASAAVKSILAAAAKEMADGRERTTSFVQTEDGEPSVKTEMFHAEEETWSRPKKRVSFATPEDDEKIRRKKMQQEDDGISKLRISAVTGAGDSTQTSSGGIKVVDITALQANNEHNSEDDEVGQPGDEDDSCTSSGEENTSETVRDSRPHVCDICDIRFQRASHLSRHRLTHTGERPFTCGGCGKSFARSDKLRVHTKICERVRAASEDPTVDMAECDIKSDITTPGTVRITHKDSRQLMFTPSGDVVLPPRPGLAATTNPVATTEPKSETNTPDTPMKRGRGRPKKPVPEGLLPKVKKRRGRPPKALSELEMMMGMGNGGLPSGLTIGPGVSGYPYDGTSSAGNTVPMQQHITPSGQQLLVKRKRGRPPKNFFQPLPGGQIPDYYDGSFNRNFKAYGRPKENYNATNLPFGDFSYLTEMMGYPNALYQQHQFQNITTVDPEQDVDMDSLSTHNASLDSQNRTTNSSGRRPDRTIDLSSSSSDDGTEDSRAEQALEGEEIPAAVCETEIMTVGDCQILKLPPEQRTDANGASSENGKLSITPVTSIGDCTIRPVDSQTETRE